MMLVFKTSHTAHVWHEFDENTDRAPCQPNTDLEIVRLAVGRPTCLACLATKGRRHETVGAASR